MYAIEKGIEELKVQLTYFNIESEETKKFIRSYTFKELEEFISQKRGNYFVFFSSYKYMEQIYTHFIDGNPDIITIIREYFQSENGLGYEYAYMYLGMNKVLQAAGRVIRSEEDKGAILLIDERFATIKYRRLYPKEWSHYKRVGDSKWIRTNLRDFWKD